MTDPNFARKFVPCGKIHTMDSDCGLERGHDELASAAESGSGAEEGQLIAERDELEEFVAACAAAAGCEREWSNLHDHRECVMEACRAFRAYVGAGKMESK